MNVSLIQFTVRFIQRKFLQRKDIVTTVFI